MDLSIIIVNHKIKEKAFRCVESVINADFENLKYEIIFVDNDSGDDSVALAQQKFSMINAVQSGKNLGMGAGNNFGINIAKGEYVLILNPDIIVKKDSIIKLYYYLKNNEKVGLAGPKLVYPDGKLQYSCFRQWRFLTPLFRRTFLGRYAKKHLENFLMNDFDHKKEAEVDWLMGSCLMAKKSVLDEVGGFDDRFFMYFEDTDLCRKIWKSGRKVVYFPESEIIHDHGRASAEKRWFFAPFTNKLSRVHIASWLKYFIKWGLKIDKFGI